MNEKELFEAIGEIDENTLSESDTVSKKTFRPKWLAATAAAAAICIAAVNIIPRFPVETAEDSAVQSTDGSNDHSPVQDTIVDTITDSPLTDAVVQDAPTDKADVMLLGEAVYPKMSAYPLEADYDNSNDYYYAMDKHQDILKAQANSGAEGYTEGYNELCAATMTEFLTTYDDKNIVYSPLNLYMSLGMLAEVTGGESRKQVLDVLGEGNNEVLREKVHSLWNSNYCNDGHYTSILSNSIWLSNRFGFNESTINTLAEKYYACSFSGEAGSDSFSEALRRWLNTSTGNLLKNESKKIQLSEDTAAALASTVNFYGQWDYKSGFNDKFTEPDIFTTASGEEITVDFMYKWQFYEPIFMGKNFTAVSSGIDSEEYNAGMWFILPNEGVSVDEVIASADMQTMICSDPNEIAYAEIYANNNNKPVGYYNPAGITTELKELHTYAPKFDITYQTDFIEKLTELGITNATDPEKSDFSPLTEETGLFLSKAEQAVRVAIDEKGVSAASFVVLEIPATGGYTEQPEVYNFILDRPFIFCITGNDNIPLFIGVVNNPTE